MINLRTYRFDTSVCDSFVFAQKRRTISEVWVLFSLDGFNR